MNLRSADRSPPQCVRTATYGFFLRVLALAAVLGIPILVISFELVSNVSADIRMASDERAELERFSHIVELVPLVEAVHGDLSQHSAGNISRDRRAVDRAFAASQAAYSAGGVLPATRDLVQHARNVWAHAARRDGVDATDAVLMALQTVASELDDDSALENDPDYSVQYLVATSLQQVPRSIVAVRRTADAIGTARGPRIDESAVERIAASRALEDQPLERLSSDVAAAVARRPGLGAALNPIMQLTHDDTRAFERRVERVLTSFYVGPDRAGIMQLAQRTIDTHVALWRRTRAEAERLVTARRDEQLVRRRVTIVFSLLAVLLGTLAITLAGRSMARRDRVALAAAQLEGDKLRAELRAVSTERALRLQEAQFRSVFENTDLGIVIFERSGAVVERNAAVAAMLGDRLERVLAGRDAAIAAFEVEREPLCVEEFHARDDGSEQWLALTFSGVYDDGTCQMVILLLRDATEEKLLQFGLLHAANHDGLTQIANRSAFESELRALLERPDERFALFYIDLDKFKPVNDTFGHAGGDHVLVTTAERLRSALAGGDLCARLGGDEFAAIVRGPNDREALRSIAERIVHSIAAPISFGGHDLSVTASVGVAIRTTDHCSPDDLKAQADRALYAVKRNAGNGLQIGECELQMTPAR